MRDAQESSADISAFRAERSGHERQMTRAALMRCLSHGIDTMIFAASDARAMVAYFKSGDYSFARQLYFSR